MYRKCIGSDATEATDREGKAANYAVVQELAAEFKKRNGSLIIIIARQRCDRTYSQQE